MELGEKLEILAGAAKYDASCASSGSDGGGMKGGGAFGARIPAGICHSWTEDGRCVSLLKVLFSNVCRYDCAYCVNRASAEKERAAFTVDELVRLTTEFYRRNYIEGLFLSSGIFADSDAVMARLIETARRLREEEGYGGYIHLKIIPGAGEKMIREAGKWADRLSANIELPTEVSLKKLAPDKSGAVIFGAMGEVKTIAEETAGDRKKRMKAVPAFAPAGQSTQLIVGASAEDDRRILELSGALYKKYEMRRVYYSAFVHPGTNSPALPPPLSFAGEGPPSSAGGELFPERRAARPLLTREHRLYQADWLLRFYHFTPLEILEGEASFLDPLVDPKAAWALRHPDFFPVDINRAPYEEIIRVPGIGAKTGRRIIETRRRGTLGFEAIQRMGAVIKRAKFFIVSGGKRLSEISDPVKIHRLLAAEDGEGLQLPLFDF